MTIYELLKKDHREVEKLFKQIEECMDEEEFDQAESLFDTLRTELTAHSKAEAEVFYQPLKMVAKNDEGEDLAWEGEQEHHVVALMLNELSRLRAEADEEEYKSKIKVLCELVDHHVEEEEGEIFPEAKKVFSNKEAEEIGRNFQELKERYKGMVDAALAEDIAILMNPIAKKGRVQNIQRSL
ncbi:hemerythrin domain-containing protein [Bdellovibrio reynosensis]|uniref:Hemerythrin domain-containing protein n=1 Tax=Bdellovibrio reynosensis TaxID=2835041 RepID=A0ABY4CA13_9BACT|nr:hemerythrin domain-containing protein [Bdellovibrio reynosensis]UOF01319.1 hemerythrin domain-containing protein [Bdellovibrio reynosensis]